MVKPIIISDSLRLHLVEYHSTPYVGMVQGKNGHHM